jgi:DNA-binding GntR family transcriptional regulator
LIINVGRKLDNGAEDRARKSATSEGSLSRTTSSAVTEKLRGEILSGRLRPGQKLRQDELARLFNTSRIPVREALIALASDGLVVLQSNRGGVVADMSQEELIEIYGIGQALEVLAVKRSVGRLLQCDIDQMASTLAGMLRRRTPAKDWYALNHEFHMTLVRACGWPTLVRLIERWREHMGRYINGFGSYGEHRATWDKEHTLILQACRDRNARMATKLIRDHWNSSYRIAQVSVRSIPSGRDGGKQSKARGEKNAPEDKGGTPHSKRT